MSGPSTRSHRSSVRGLETTLVELCGLLKAKKSVVMITGAGLSAASGIPTFRGGSDSIWRITAAAKGRRSVFLRDPLRWYNEFFLRHFPMSFTRKAPNAGHEAVAALARSFPKLRVITQNIDGLHQGTVNTWPDPLRLIEAHGRLGLFKCVADDENGECRYSFDKEVEPSAFPESVSAVLDDDLHVAAANGRARLLTEIPRCPHCGEPSPPMSLLFDEDYDSHSFYNFERVEEWLKEADAVVFVGTSFAVTLTSLAIREAKRRRIPVFDFNLSVSLKASPALDVKTVLGPAETTLPTLARLAGATMVRLSVTSSVSNNNCSDSNGGRNVFATSRSPVSTPPTTEPQDSEGGRTSSLGRRLREEKSGGSNVDIMEGGGAAKRARCVSRVKQEVGTAVGPVVPPAEDGSAGDAASTEVWGGGAPFLLEPALEVPLRMSQVHVDLSEAYSRKIHPEPKVEANIETLWQRQLARNPLIFNGTKFRLAGYSTEGNSTADTAAIAATDSADTTDSSEEGDKTITSSLTPRSSSPSSSPTRKLRLRLGLTDYRTFRGTNWSPAAARLAADGARDFPWLEGAYLSQKLGVGAVVETTDGFVLTLRRSKGVAEGQGRMDAPGGHPEPKNLGLTPGVLSGLSGKQKSSQRKLGHQSTEELFDSAVQEVVDETNVPRSALGEPLLSGLVRQGNSFGAPSAAFTIPCFLKQAEVSVLYNRGAKESFESTELQAIPSVEIVAEGTTAWFAKRGLQATPSFLGALELWRAHRLRGVV